MNSKIPITQLFNLTFLRFPLAFIWSSLLLIIVQYQVLNFAPATRKGSYVSLVLTTGALVTFLSQPIMGAISDHYNKRTPFIFTGGVLAAVILMSLAFAKTLLAFLVFYLLLQLTVDIAEAPHYALVSDLASQKELGRVSGFANLMTFGGQILGPLTAGFLIQKKLLSGYYLIATVTLIVSVILLRIKIKEQPLSSTKDKFYLFKIVKSFWINPRLHPRFSFVLSGQFFLTLSFYTIISFLLFFAKDFLQIRDYALATSYWIAVSTIAAAVSVYFTGRYLDKKGFKKPILLAAILIVPTVTIFMFTTSFEISLALAAIFGFAQGIFATSTYALAMKYLPKKSNSGKDLGIWVSVSLGAQVLAPVSGGLILDKFNLISPNLGYRILFAIALFYVFLGAKLLLASLKSKEIVAGPS